MPSATLAPTPSGLSSNASPATPPPRHPAPLMTKSSASRRREKIRHATRNNSNSISTRRPHQTMSFRAKRPRFLLPDRRSRAARTRSRGISLPMIAPIRPPHAPPSPNPRTSAPPSTPIPNCAPPGATPPPTANPSQLPTPPAKPPRSSPTSTTWSRSSSPAAPKTTPRSPAPSLTWIPPLSPR